MVASFCCPQLFSAALSVIPATRGEARNGGFRLKRSGVRRLVEPAVSLVLPKIAIGYFPPKPVS